MTNVDDPLYGNASLRVSVEPAAHSAVYRGSGARGPFLAGLPIPLASMLDVTLDAAVEPPVDPVWMTGPLTIETLSAFFAHRFGDGVGVLRNDPAGQEPAMTLLGVTLDDDGAFVLEPKNYVVSFDWTCEVNDELFMTVTNSELAAEFESHNLTSGITVDAVVARAGNRVLVPVVAELAGTVWHVPIEAELVDVHESIDDGWAVEHVVGMLEASGLRLRTGVVIDALTVTQV
jgi:hypothetical protein